MPFHARLLFTFLVRAALALGGLLLGLAARPLRAQPAPAAGVTLSGQVLDARTRQPLSAASVFLANTTYGTAADSAGRFTLVGVRPGQYELVASYLGYQLASTPVALLQSATRTVLLQPAGVQLDEVSVRPGKNNPADFRRFTRLFLGSSTWSQQCRIENPEAVVVLYDKQSQVLTAVAPQGLQVLNPALGYRVTFHQFKFKVDYRAGQQEFAAAPSFTELPAADARLGQHWQANRRRAYAGSLPHFLRSVRDNQLAATGFVVRRLLPLPDTEAARQRIAQAADSLQQVLRPAPGVVALVYKQPLPAPQLRRADAATQRVWLRFPGAVQVSYQGEQPDAAYAAAQALGSSSFRVETVGNKGLSGQSGSVLGHATYTTQPEVSELQLLQPEVLVLPTGYLLNPLSIKVEGYWAFEKIGETLPLNYAPNTGQ